MTVIPLTDNERAEMGRLAIRVGEADRVRIQADQAHREAALRLQEQVRNLGEMYALTNPQISEDGAYLLGYSVKV
jgi:hypothetical protein